VDLNKNASGRVWAWLEEAPAPENSITRSCQNKSIPVLMFTGMACDFWQVFGNDWGLIGWRAKKDFNRLVDRFFRRFHYVCMGSAVIHPEVFTKALALNRPKRFTADVVDFKDMYRPMTRVARYGKYYRMTHKEYLKGELCRT
jgi:hypothetical protein